MTARTAASTVAIDWVDEPPAPRSGHRTGARWADELAVLRTRPGRWARIASDLKASTAHSSAKALRDSRGIPDTPAGAYEAVARATRPGICDLYARYIAPDERGEQ